MNSAQNENNQTSNNLAVQNRVSLESIQRNEDRQMRDHSMYAYSSQDSWMELGKGSFGTVFEASLLYSSGLGGEPDERKEPVQLTVAIKRIPWKMFQFSELRRMMQLCRVTEHVPLLIDFWKDDLYCYLVLEKLEDIIDSKMKLRKSLAHRIPDILRQIIMGLRVCHEHNIIHGDLKPSNIMLNHSGVVKIIDWDDTAYDPKYSKSLDASSRKKRRERDMWAFSIMAYELIVGFLPDLSKISYPTRIGQTSADFLCLCFSHADNPQGSYSTILEHPFLRQ